MTAAWRVAWLLALALAGGACGAVEAPGSAAHPSATPTSVVTALPSGSAGGQGGQGGPDRCHTAGLSLSALGRPGAGAGNVVQEFGLTNRTGAACTFFGYVGMALIDGSGNPLPTRVVRDAGSVFPFAHRATYTVQPGATAPFWVHWEDVVVATQPACTTSAGIVVTPPDETTQLRLDGVQVMACNGGQLDVSPMTAPGTTGP
jgi:Protein of unknown function (DUF4232)